MTFWEKEKGALRTVAWEQGRMLSPQTDSSGSHSNTPEISESHGGTVAFIFWIRIP